MEKVVFYQTNGIAVHTREDVKTKFYIQENIDQKLFDSRFFYAGDSIMYDLEALCVDLYDVFQNLVFPNVDEYYKQIDFLPQGIIRAGLDSDFNLSKEDFQKYFDDSLAIRISEIMGKAGISMELEQVYKQLDLQKFRYAYLADCHSYVSSVQSLIQSCMSNFVNFYKHFCKLEGTADFCEDYYGISTDGLVVISMATNIFVSMYSIFDILTKIVLEIENIRDPETQYPKFASAKKLYGNRKEIKNIDVNGTIFEKSRNISIIENLRNELVHNAAWEMNPKVFFHMDKNTIVDKTIYFPDFSEEGHLITYKNRKRFFSQGVCLNEILPEIYFEGLRRIRNTLEKIVGKTNNCN